MANELATCDLACYPVLDPDSGVAEAIAENLGNAQLSVNDLTHVPIPTGGSTKWVIDGAAGEEQVDAIEGILVYHGDGGVIWPHTEPKKGTRPYLRTFDLVTAHKFGDDPGDLDVEAIEKCRNEDGSYDWHALVVADGAPFGWGTGKGGVGKRAKEHKILCVLPQDQAFPLMIRAQPGSLKDTRQFFLKLTKAMVPHYRAVVRLTLEKAESQSTGTDFAKIAMSLVSTLPRDAGIQLKKMFKDTLDAAYKSGRLEDDSQSPSNDGDDDAYSDEQYDDDN